MFFYALILTVLIVVAEICVGMALVGGPGGLTIVERDKTSFAFWLVVGLHAVIGLTFSSLLLMGN